MIQRSTALGTVKNCWTNFWSSAIKTLPTREQWRIKDVWLWSKAPFAALRLPDCLICFVFAAAALIWSFCYHLSPSYWLVGAPLTFGGIQYDKGFLFFCFFKQHTVFPFHEPNTAMTHADGDDRLRRFYKWRLMTFSTIFHALGCPECTCKLWNGWNAEWRQIVCTVRTSLRIIHAEA